VLIDTKPPLAGALSVDTSDARPFLRVTFTEPLLPAPQASALLLENLTTGQTIPAGGIIAVYDSATRTATFTFTDGQLPDGIYRATIVPDAITDPARNTLAGTATAQFAWLGGSVGNDTYEVRRNGDVIDIFHNGAMTPTVSIAAASTVPITIGGGGGDASGSDTLIVDQTGGSIGSLLFDGGAGVDELIVIGHGDDAYNVTTGGVGKIAHVSVENLTFGAGTFNVTQDLSNAAVTVASDAIAIFNVSQRLRGLTVLGVGRLPMGGSPKALVAEELAVGSAGQLDLADHDLVVDYSDASPLGSWDGTKYTGVAGMIQSAMNYHEWDGPGIRTSAAPAKLGVTTLGIGEANEVLFLSGGETTLWNGVTVDATSVIVKYTYAGDVNFDGLVDGADYGTLDNFIQFPGTDGYVNGDVNYDGIIDGADYGTLDNAIQLQGLPL